MRKSIIALVFGACLLPDAAFTLGLGEIEVNSALNQNLDADIALLSATPEDAEQLIVKLAPAAEFSRAGIDRPYFLNSLRFTTEQKNGQLFIKVTTPKPVREPFLNFLLELDWPKGHLLREYTILLDPPVFMGAQSAPAPVESSGRPAAMQATRKTAPAALSSQGGFRPAAASVSVPQRQAQPAKAASQQGAVPRPSKPVGSRRVQAGDTAWSLANAMRPDSSVSVEQMLIAILRTNPEVFINNNVNGLKRGYILRAPDAQTLAAIDRNQAVALVREQNALWREYQQQLASGTPASAMAGESSKTVGDDMTGKAGARLSIVSAGMGESTSAGKDPTQMSMDELRRELALASEQLETERVEKEELNARIETLQAQVEKMKSLLTVDDASMAQMQAAAQDKIGAAMPQDAMKEIMASQPKDAAPEPAAEADSPMAGEEPMADDTATTQQTDAAAQTDEAEQPLFVDEQETEPMGEGETGEMVAEMTEQAMPSDDVSVADEVMDTLPSDFTTTKPKSFIDQILGNKTLLAAAGGGAVLLAGLLAFLFKRRKSGEEAPAATTAAMPVEDELEKVADLVEDETVSDVVTEDVAEHVKETTATEDEEDFDAESTMVLSTEDTVVTQAGDSEERGEDERDDVIAEADVYLAYGIFQQAEELLQNAIEEHPDREAYRVKLAETHYASKNTDAFIDVARALKEKSGTDSKGWAKVVAMGKDLCPDDDLFVASDMVGGVDPGELAPKVPEMDFDLDGVTGDEADTELDFSLDDEPLDLPGAADAEDGALEVTELEEAATAEIDELEFDLSETEAVAPEPEDAKVEAGDEEFSLDIDASELDLDEKASDEAIDLSAEFDEAEIDISEELSETLVSEATEAEAAADELDRMLDETARDKTSSSNDDEDIGMDTLLEAATGESVAPVAEVADSGQGEAEVAVDLEIDDDSLGDLDDVDEVGTKLDLARAYLDMGDSEGTRSILDEVMAEGNDEQKKEAQALLNKLG